MPLDILSYNIATEALDKSGNIGTKSSNTTSIQDGQVMVYSDSEGKFIPQYPATNGSIAKNITLISSIVNNDVTKCQIQFKNPKDDAGDLLKVKMFISYVEDLNMKNYQYMIDNNILLYKDDFLITSEAINTYDFPINDSNRGQTLYVIFFTEWNFTEVTRSSGVSFSRKLKDEIPNDPITSFTSIQSVDKVILNWINPSGTNNIDFAKLVIIENENHTPTNINDGVKVYEGNQNTITLNNKDKSKHYCYRAFVFDSSNNIQDNISQITDIQMDNTPPLAVQSLTSTNGHQYIKLRWDETNCGTDWKKTYVVQKMGNVSSSNISDGTLILTNQTKNSYKINWFIISGLTNSQQYTFTFFVEDINGNIGNSVSITDTPTASALPTPVAFNADMNGTNQTEIKISWINPFSSDYSGRILYHSFSDLSGKTKAQLDDMVTNSQANILNQGVGTGSGANDQYINTGITSGVTNYYAMVTKYNIAGTDYYSAVVDDNATTSDIVPPSNVTNLQVVGGDNTLSISYTDPSDTDYDKTIIIVTKGSFQNYNYNGLDLIYTEEATKDKYKTLPLTLTNTNGIVNNTTYYVWVFPKDTTGNINTNIANRSSVQPQPLPIYSISYNSSTKTWTRLGLASSMSASDFNSISPYKDIKRVLLTDAKVKTYLKSTDSTLKEDGTSATLDGTQGNVFSEIPKFYYKYNYDGTSIHTWTIANSAIGGCTLHPAFIRNSVNKDYLYIGSYKGYVNGTKLESRSGILPTTNGKSFSDFITLAEARGTGFTQFDSLSLHVLQLLFIMQYGTPDTSTILGGGQDLGSVLTTGGTNSLGNSTGKIGNYSSLYGVENIFGESHNTVVGLIAGSKYFQANNSFSSMTSESTTGTYTQLSSTTPSTTNGFIGDIEPISSAFIGKTMDASSTTGFDDYQLSKNGSNLNVLLMGGSALADQRGLFNNEFVDVSVMSSTNNMTNEGSIDTYTAWSVSIDKTAYGIKSISSFSLVDGTTPALQTNLSINNLSGRLIAY